MKLKLIGYRVVSLNMEAQESGSCQEQTCEDFDLQIGQFFPENQENVFGVGFKISFQQETYSLRAEMRFFFETDSGITEDFKKSSYPSVNAPAIAFPYLRSFISVVTMQSGYPSVMLPSVNFVEFARKVKSGNR